MATLPSESGPPEPVAGEKRRTGRGHVDSYGDDRVCVARDCTTVLSRYNARAWCWRHSAATNDRRQ
jgi:hypothetical protein